MIDFLVKLRNFLQVNTFDYAGLSVVPFDESGWVKVNFLVKKKELEESTIEEALEDVHK